MQNVSNPSGRASVPADEDAEGVLIVAAARGWTLSRMQLERRHRAGLIPRPRQVALGSRSR